jgi:tellurite resistance protein
MTPTRSVNLAMSDQLVRRQCALGLVDIGPELPDKTGLLHWRAGAVMTKRYTHSSATTAEHMADRLDNRDEDVMQGLVTAGALVALADGRVEEVERDELLNFIDRQQLAPTIPRTDIAEVFDRRVQQLEDRDSAEVIIENLRPLVGLSLASVVLRTAQRVAAADRQIHPGELQALELIRLIMTSLSAKGLPVRLRTGDTVGCESVSAYYLHNLIGDV